MTDSSLYTIINGEPMVSAEGMGLLMGVPVEQVRKAIGKGAAGVVTIPTLWIKNGRRRRKECAAALGHEPSLTESVDYWAAVERGASR